MQGHPRGDREWEEPAGRKAPDEGIRHRLRALFSATDDEETVEAQILERGREIEARTEQLQATIEGLQRREEQAGKLRSAVEEMLRHGSAELDERQAQLAELALDLRAREELVRAQERDIAARKQELGAVELRRAALERREEALAERGVALELAEAELRSREPGPAEADEAESDVAGHVLYLAADGYRIVERHGRVPAVEARVDVDGRAFVVTRVGRSTLPGDRRPCAYLEPARDDPHHLS